MISLSDNNIIDGAFDPRLIYLRLLSVDCNATSVRTLLSTIVFGPFAGGLNFAIAVNLTDFFVRAFFVLEESICLGCDLVIVILMK
jgi:hypothetical protein